MVNKLYGMTAKQIADMICDDTVSAERFIKRLRRDTATLRKARQAEEAAEKLARMRAARGLPPRR